MEENEPKRATPAPASPATTPGTRKDEQTDRTTAMFCHLLALSGFVGVPLGNFLGPLILWLVKRGESSRVDEAGKEALNFQISLLIYGAGIFLLLIPALFIPFLNFVLIPLGLLAIFGIVIAGMVLTVIAALKTGEGTPYQYPCTLRFIR